MTRRTFLETTGAASAAASVSCGPAPATKQGSSASASFEFDEVTIAGLQDSMKSGKHSAQSIAEAYLGRIRTIDQGAAGVHSVIEINPDALSMAQALDDERKQKGARGPLHGIPILLKDNIDTAGSMKTTAGSLALANSVAAQDSAVAQRLRAAGAVILGKTNLSEWANFRSGHSVSGWSGRGGQTRNPYALDRNPCGSSSGSGAAVAANLCTAAIGTETNGSVVCPSSINGIVGIKPTLGLISRAGIIPIAHSQDTAGPMARTVRDAAILMGALAGIDPRDPATQSSAGKAQADYMKFLDPAGLKGARLGVARKFFGFNSVVDRIMENCLAEMKRQGAEIIDPADLPFHGKYGDSEFEVLLYEFKADLNAYLAGLGPQSNVRNIGDVIAFNEKNKDKEMPYFDQDTMIKAEAKGPLTDKAYLDALARNHLLSRAEGIDAVIATHRLDAIIGPTAGPAWIIDWINGDHDSGGCSTPAAVAGYPHITVPAGFIHGLPVGISFFGSAWSEPTLLKLAYGFEQATKARRAPRFLPTADMNA